MTYKLIIRNRYFNNVYRFTAYFLFALIKIGSWKIYYKVTRGNLHTHFLSPILWESFIRNRGS